jgi:hypothetical protein
LKLLASWSWQEAQSVVDAPPASLAARASDMIAAAGQFICPPIVFVYQPDVPLKRSSKDFAGQKVGLGVP